MTCLQAKVNVASCDNSTECATNDGCADRKLVFFHWSIRIDGERVVCVYRLRSESAVVLLFYGNEVYLCPCFLGLFFRGGVLFLESRRSRVAILGCRCVHHRRHGEVGEKIGRDEGKIPP